MRYELVRHLATGGMAELYLARPRDDASAPCVVLKRILPAHVRNAHHVTMFLDEVRLVARLDHPNLARLIEIGHSGDNYFYTMEYVHGENVRALLRRAQSRDVRVPVEVSLSIIAAAAAGLHAAHEARDRDGAPLDIVHRDVSPSNVMVGHDGTVKVVDFGVACAADRLTETRTGTVKGTIAYMSPEQCRLRPVDRRSDVFALGIVAWELLTQQRLFRYECDYDAMHAIIAGPIVPPSAVCDDIAPWLDALVLRALDRDPDRRPQTAAELRHALLEGARQEGLELGTPLVAAYMESLFGRPPLPWLDPTFATLAPDGEVVTLDLHVPPRERSTTDETRAIREPVAGEPVTAEPEVAGPARRSWSATIATGAAALTMVTLAVMFGLGDDAPPSPASIPASSNPPASLPAPTATVTTPPPAREPYAPADMWSSTYDSSTPTYDTAASRRVPTSSGTSRRNGKSRPRPAAPADARPPAAAGPQPALPAHATPLARARAAAGRGEWRTAAGACEEGLRTQPSDVELVTICATAACEQRRAAVARYYIDRLPAEAARTATTVCLRRGTFMSSTECEDDPTRCR